MRLEQGAHYVVADARQARGDGQEGCPGDLGLDWSQPAEELNNRLWTMAGNRGELPAQRTPPQLVMTEPAHARHRSGAHQQAAHTLRSLVPPPLEETHVHVCSCRNARVATYASRLQRTCTCVSDRGTLRGDHGAGNRSVGGAATMLVHGEEQSSAPRRQAKRRKGAPKSSVS